MDYSKEDYAMLYNDKPQEPQQDEPVDHSGLPWYLWLALGIAAMVVALSGCATLIDEHTAPRDWPTLTVKDNVVSGFEVIGRCYKYQQTYMKLLGSIPFACAEINFAELTCNIYRAYDASPEILEHEQIHCRGGQHPGDTTLEDAWRAFKASERK